MTLVFTFQHLLFLLAHLLSCSTISSLPALIALQCTSPSPQSINTNINIDTLWAKAAATGFANLKLPRFKGLIQCRLNLSPNDCTQCILTATHTVSTHCQSSEDVMAWFDGCYVYYSYHHNSFQLVKSTNSNISPATTNLPRFSSALNTLLLNLRTSIISTSSRRYCHGEIPYNKSGHKLYGLAECVRSVSEKDCGICVGEAITKLYKCCGRKQGGMVATESCMVQFETYRFYSLPMPNDGRAYSDGRGSEFDAYDHKETENHVRTGKNVLWVWGILVSCFILVVAGTWLLRRRIVNSAKVATITEESF